MASEVVIRNKNLYRAVNYSSQEGRSRSEQDSFVSPTRRILAGCTTGIVVTDMK